VTFLRDAERLSTVVQEKDGRYWAFSKKDPKYDITDTIHAIEKAVIRRSDEQMRAELSKQPEGSLRVFRLRSGRDTKFFRAANGQQIQNSAEHLGTDPWVRAAGKEVPGGVWEFIWRHRGARVLVAPANGDALRAAMYSEYLIRKNLEDTLKEVRGSGRTIRAEVRSESGRLVMFEAGPDAEARFGVTRYEPWPDNPEHTTRAIGELKLFWVAADDLEPLGGETVSSYVHGASPAAAPVAP
jgi:hypothetical protein